MQQQKTLFKPLSNLLKFEFSYNILFCQNLFELMSLNWCHLWSLRLRLTMLYFHIHWNQLLSMTPLFSKQRRDFSGTKFSRINTWISHCRVFFRDSYCLPMTWSDRHRLCTRICLPRNRDYRANLFQTNFATSILPIPLQLTAPPTYIDFYPSFHNFFSKCHMHRIRANVKTEVQNT